MVACPRNHFYRTLERIVCAVAPAVSRPHKAEMCLGSQLRDGATFATGSATVSNDLPSSGGLRLRLTHPRPHLVVTPSHRTSLRRCLHDVLIGRQLRQQRQQRLQIALCHAHQVLPGLQRLVL
jgi:hypothetical protein